MNAFKKLRNKIGLWLYGKREEVTTIKIGDIKFTPLKKKYPEFNTKNISWTDKQLQLKEDIMNGNFIKNKNSITISSDYVCLDGHHRITSLLEKYGPDYEIDVYKLTNRYWSIFLVSIFYVIFFSND